MDQRQLEVRWLLALPAPPGLTMSKSFSLENVFVQLKLTQALAGFRLSPHPPRYRGEHRSTH